MEKSNVTAPYEAFRFFFLNCGFPSYRFLNLKRTLLFSRHYLHMAEFLVVNVTFVGLKHQKTKKNKSIFRFDFNFNFN